MLALTRLHSGGGGALADAAGYARASLTLAQQGRRQIPPEVLSRLGDLLEFGPEGFTALRIEPALVRDKEHLRALVEAGFTTKPLLQILSNTEARALESRWNIRLEEFGELPAVAEPAASIAQQYFAVIASYAGTHRILLLRGSPPFMAPILAQHRRGLPYVRLPAGLHRELSALEAPLDSQSCPEPARLFAQGLALLERGSSLPRRLHLQRALVDWIHQESPKFRPPKAAPAPIEAAVREAVCRLYVLRPANAQSEEFFGRLRSGIPTRVRVLISTSDGIELSANSAERSHLIVVRMVEGPAALFELVFEGPAAIAIPKGSVAHSSDLDALRTQNALVPATHRLTRNH